MVELTMSSFKQLKFVQVIIGIVLNSISLMAMLHENAPDSFLKCCPLRAAQNVTITGDVNVFDMTDNRGFGPVGTL
jgi:hypothetical protein